nr:uncharacterized protein LOC113692409 [Coffea arabica]XP_027066623.1 uncharacterized protein LOC113692409 [Coffea arabica]
MPVVLKEILHFMDRELGILAYDPYKGPHSCRIIELPGDIDREWSKRVDEKTILFDVHRGHLRFFAASNAYNDGLRISMWTLSDYDEGHWLLEHRISLSELACDISFPDSPYLVPITFHPFDSDTVYLGCIVGKFALYLVVTHVSLLLLQSPLSKQKLSDIKQRDAAIILVDKNMIMRNKQGEAFENR